MKEQNHDMIRSFYDGFASQYDKLFLNWQAAAQNHAGVIDRIVQKYQFDRSATILDCACGIGTQAIGLAMLGYRVTASDISTGELAEAQKRAAEHHVDIRFQPADFCTLSEVFSEQFDIIIAMDNALPHMLSPEALNRAIKSITGRLSDGGIFVASIRDYDRLLAEKPTHTEPYIHKTERGQRISFQTWEWDGDNYQFIQYLIDDEDELKVSRFACEYRATRRKEITDLLCQYGCSEVVWMMPDETDYYQPIVLARK